MAASTTRIKTDKTPRAGKPAEPTAREKMEEYLISCGGVDKHEFKDSVGQPDPQAAYAFAEKMKAILPPEQVTLQVSIVTLKAMCKVAPSA